MRSSMHLSVLLIGWMCLTGLTSVAQQSQRAPHGATATAAVPNLIKYSGVLRGGSGAAITGLSGVTFLIYQDEQGGAPLWMETQNVQPDKASHYTVQLGAVSKDGLPPEVFMTGEARWLAVQVAGGAEQARVQLLAVPYAMKAADAQTLGGIYLQRLFRQDPLQMVHLFAQREGARDLSGQFHPGDLGIQFITPSVESARLRKLFSRCSRSIGAYSGLRRA